MSAVLRDPVGPGDHTAGPPDALVTLVEYGDFQCPHCAAAHPIVQTIRNEMGHWLRFVYRHFPLTEIHPHAAHAAEIAEGAAEFGKFWQMHDLLFRNQRALSDGDLIRYAAALDIDPQWAAQALRTGAYEPKVRNDFIGGVRSGVNGTPTFFINGVRHDGSWDLESLRAALQAVLYDASRP